MTERPPSPTPGPAGARRPGRTRSAAAPRKPSLADDLRTDLMADLGSPVPVTPVAPEAPVSSDAPSASASAGRARPAGTVKAGAPVAPRPVSVLPVAPDAFPPDTAAARPGSGAASPALVVTISPFSWAFVPRLSVQDGPTITFGPVTITLR